MQENENAWLHCSEDKFLECYCRTEEELVSSSKINVINSWSKKMGNFNSGKYLVHLMTEKTHVSNVQDNLYLSFFPLPRFIIFNETELHQ